VRATVFSLKIAKLSDEIGIEVTAGIADTMDSPRPAWLVFGNERLGIIDAHREIKNGVVRKSVAPSGGEVALEDVVTGKARRALTRDKAQEQASTLLDGFAENFFPDLADLNLLLVKPDKATGLLELADDVACDF